MKSRVTIHKNYATLKTEIRVLKYDNRSSYYMNSEGCWMPLSEGEVIPVTLNIPIESEVQFAEGDKESSSQLKQKDLDKNSHIQNLNEIIEKVLNKL